MDYKHEVKTFLELHSSIDNPKTIRAIAESLSIPESEAGLAIHSLIHERAVKTAHSSNTEGFMYYI